ncbi:NlpC/P60 family protein [Clostridium butyricum]|uniref:C40 family peptidase n=1 Tax=Clostridium butyricum TaxID=1492 RepID=UPI0034673597
MRSRKIQTLVAVMVISCMTVTSGMPVFAAPSETVAADTEITANDGTDSRSIEKVIQNIQECDSQIEYKMGKLNELKEQILEKENQIQENEQKIELAEADIEEKDNALAERLNIIQKNGGIESTPMKYLDALLSSEDILDAVQKVHLISKICTSDKKLIQNAKDAKDNLTQIKENIEKEQKELEKSKGYLENEIKELETDKEKLIDYVKENSSLLDLSTNNIIPVTLPSDISEEAKAIILEAEKYLGVPYLWGGTTPDGFDCSGYMQYIFASKNISIPRVSQDQQSFSTKVSMSEIKPGDLVFNKASDSTHVGMYIGNDMYIHAPHTGDVVKISQLSTSNMKYAGRILESSTSSSSSNN